MHASAVIGMNWGDEGKGLVTDYLCHKLGASLVVRYNGGAQAGHTVVANGRVHIFSHFGSGTAMGVPTYLGPHFIVNPRLWQLERESLGLPEPQLLVHPMARVTTPYDVWINHVVEEHRGQARHGSCGAGIFETVRRCETAYATYVTDLVLGEDHLRARLGALAKEWVPLRLAAYGIKQDDLCKYQQVDAWIETCEQFVGSFCVTPHIPSGKYGTIVFEGAQGLLLDAENAEFFPYLTPSRPGLPNVLELCRQLGIDDLDVYYVTRSYMTRHGPGPFPTEDPDLYYHDSTNITNHHQGQLRFGSLDFPRMRRAVREDLAHARYGSVRVHQSIALTWADVALHEKQLIEQIQTELEIPVALVSRGRTRKDVTPCPQQCAANAAAI